MVLEQGCSQGKGLTMISYSPGVLQPLEHGHKGSRDPIQLHKYLSQGRTLVSGHPMGRHPWS